MKNKLLIGFFIVVLVLVFISMRNTNPRVSIAHLAAKGEIKTESLRYRVYLFGVIPVAEALFEPETTDELQDKKVLHLRTTAQSLKIYSPVFQAHAELDSYADPKTRNPIVFRQKTFLTGKGESVKEVFYDQKKGIMTREGEQRQIPPDTQDPLSAISRIRRMNFDLTDTFELNINTNQKNYTLSGTAHQKLISIKDEVFQLVYATSQIRRKEKSPYHSCEIKMVLLKEHGNIPVLIKVFAGGAFICARLVETK